MCQKLIGTERAAAGFARCISRLSRYPLLVDSK